LELPFTNWDFGGDWKKDNAITAPPFNPPYWLKNGTLNIDLSRQTSVYLLGRANISSSTIARNKVGSSTFQEENHWVLKPQNANLAKIF
jgi:hypothetical protein